MLTIGVIGGVASGKSEVARLFVARGATLLNADLVGHEVLHEPAVIESLVDRWGPQILDSEGNIRRSAVAAIVFAPAGDADREFLNQVTHPRIADRLATQLKACRSRGCPVAILDAALLLEAGWDSLCDEVIFVDVPESLRRARALTRGWSDAELERRERTQLALEVKRARATVLIDNSASLAALAAQVDDLWRKWVPV